MDWTDYFILSSAVATASLVWRQWLLDHPKFDASVERIPFLGEGLVCGFCFPLYLTLIAVLFSNPIQGWTFHISLGYFEPFFMLLMGWMSVGLAVLAMRFLVVALMDGSAILSHKHRESHRQDS